MAEDYRVAAVSRDVRQPRHLAVDPEVSRDRSALSNQAHQCNNHTRERGIYRERVAAAFAHAVADVARLSQEALYIQERSDVATRIDPR